MIRKKTKEEIEVLREGGKILAGIIQEVSKKIKPGVSTAELHDIAHDLLTKDGNKPAFLNYIPHGAKRPYPASICISVNDEIVHGIPNENPIILKEGDLITLDAGLIYKGLVTDHAITFPVGEISKENKKLLQVTKEALQSAIKEARVGNRIGDIGAVIEKRALDNELSVVEGLSGHGVGYAIHEDPYVPNSGRKGTGEILEEGMVIAIEPMFAIGKGHIKLDSDGYTYRTKDGSMSAQFEHTVAITEDGPVVLTAL